MKSNRIQILMLGTASALCPAVLFAQADPMSPAASQSQPNQPRQTRPTTPSMQDSVGNNGDTGQMMQDKMFLRKAAEGGIAEVELGKLAVQKASSPDVKAFGQKMVDDHTALNNEMATVADTLGVMLPKKMNKDDQAEYDKLSALSGDDFDMEYLRFMVKDHHTDLREFRIEAASTSDQTLRDAVDKGSKMIHEHMVMVDKMAKAKGIPMPGRSKPTPVPPPAS
jgi:putative membrane protein